jgi:hypothetical protein
MNSKFKRDAKVRYSNQTAETFREKQAKTVVLET